MEARKENDISLSPLVELVEDPKVVSILLQLPIELLQILLDYILAQKPEEAVLYLFPATGSCKSLHVFFQPSLNSIGAKRLAEYALKGELGKVTDLLNNNPTLLLNEVKVMDRAGRIIQGTLLQIFLGMRNIIACKLIAPFFADLSDGNQVIQTQIDKQFPPYLDFSYYEKFDFSNLLDVLSSDPLTQDQMNEATSQLFQSLLPFFKPEVITMGRHFDMRHFLDALEAYYLKYDVLNREQRSLYCLKVLGLLQSLFTHFDAQLFCLDLNESIRTMKRNTDDHFKVDTQMYDDTPFFSEELGDTHYISGRRRIEDWLDLEEQWYVQNGGAIPLSKEGAKDWRNKIQQVQTTQEAQLFAFIAHPETYCKTKSWCLVS